METRIAKTISIVFSPLIIPTLGVLILFNVNTFIAQTIPLQAKTFIILIIFINTAIVPLFAVLLMKRFGLIGNLLLYDRNERLLPLIAAVFLYFFTYYILRQANVPSLLHFYFLGATFLVIISLFITLKWKISLHMASMGGLTGLLLSTAFLLRIDINFLIISTIIVSGLVGSSRLKLNSHSISQVFAGYILGVLLMLILYFIFRGVS